MTITGKYKKDENFTTVYVDNRIYTIARNTGEYGVAAVGGHAATGGVITQELYDRWSSECAKTGTFEL